MRWLGLTVTGIALLMPMYALSEPYVRYRPGYSTTYASTEETIEKLEILLEELEQGEHDAVIKTAEKSYSVVRKTEHQCANYHKALSRIKSSSVEGQKKKRSAREYTSYSSSSYYKTDKSEQEKRYEESLRKFREQSADFSKSLAPVMVQLQVSEGTWKGTWGIEYFCSYGSFGEQSTMFRCDEKTLKEALISCVKVHLEAAKTKRGKSNFL